jgi:hypothetical protein
MGKYKKIAGIYIISCSISKKVYIGHSTGLKRRWSTHKNRLRANKHKNSHLQAAWNLYKEDSFSFAILELLPQGWTKQEYEKVETKWVLYYNSHLSEFGYNGCLPGSIPLKGVGENITKTLRKKIEYVYINTSNRETKECIGLNDLAILLKTKPSKIADASTYWRGCGKIKSIHGYIVVRKSEYNETFDYIGFKRPKTLKNGYKKTWKDYYNKEKYRKSPEDIIPHSERNLKRVPIVSVNIETGEEKYYPMLKDCYMEFLPAKVYKCISNEYGKYQHRGHYFKRG